MEKKSTVQQISVALKNSVASSVSPYTTETIQVDSSCYGELSLGPSGWAGPQTKENPSE